MSNPKYFSPTALESLREDYMHERSLLKKKIQQLSISRSPIERGKAIDRFRELGRLLNKLYIETHGQ